MRLLDGARLDGAQVAVVEAKVRLDSDVTVIFFGHPGLPPRGSDQGSMMSRSQSLSSLFSLYAPLHAAACCPPTTPTACGPPGKNLPAHHESTALHWMVTVMRSQSLANEGGPEAVEVQQPRLPALTRRRGRGFDGAVPA